MNFFIMVSLFLSAALGVFRGIDLALLTDAETGLCIVGSVWLRYIPWLAALVLPRSWFWVAWFWQMNNISLMGMTLYMHRRLRRLPEDIWIQDGGTVVTVYAPQDIGEMNRE